MEIKIRAIQVIRGDNKPVIRGEKSEIQVKRGKTKTARKSKTSERYSYWSLSLELVFRVQSILAHRLPTRIPLSPNSLVAAFGANSGTRIQQQPTDNEILNPDSS